MNTIEIYRAGVLFTTIYPDESSTQVKQMMGDNVLNLTFVTNSYIDFQFGDTCQVFGEFYKINTLPTVKRVLVNLFEYSMVMQAEYFDLTRAQFLFLNSENNLRESDFSLMGKAIDFVNLIVDNITRIMPGWSIGDIEDTPFKNMTFSKENCLEAIQRVSEEFGIEFWIEGRIIHLYRRRIPTDISLEYGRNSGLYNISRLPIQNGRLVTRLYVYGAEKNLPPNYRNFAPRLKMYGGEDYIEANTEIFGIIEDTAIFDNIYPHRTGVVTQVGGDEFSIIDTTMNFDVNQFMLPGIEPKITFNTGQLSGYTFKMSRFDPMTKEFRFHKNTEEKAMEIPSQNFKAKVGDQYVITDIYMPQQYVTEAEQELKSEGNKELARLSMPQYSYAVELDPKYMRRMRWDLKLGMEIEIFDVQLVLNQVISLVSITRNLRNEFFYSIEISNQKQAGRMSQIDRRLGNNSREISQIRRAFNPIEENRVVGNLTIENGSIILPNIPINMTGQNLVPIMIDMTTGFIYRTQ